jgi:hypothetical protein
VTVTPPGRRRPGRKCRKGLPQGEPSPLRPGCPGAARSCRRRGPSGGGALVTAAPPGRRRPGRKRRKGSPRVNRHRFGRCPGDGHATRPAPGSSGVFRVLPMSPRPFRFVPVGFASFAVHGRIRRRAVPFRWRRAPKASRFVPAYPEISRFRPSPVARFRSKYSRKSSQYPWLTWKRRILLSCQRRGVLQSGNP